MTDHGVSTSGQLDAAAVAVIRTLRCAGNVQDCRLDIVLGRRGASPRYRFVTILSR